MVSSRKPGRTKRFWGQLAPCCAALLLCLSGCSLGGCIKRIPARAGADRQVVAGRQISLGQPVQLPQGSNMVWGFGDGQSGSGPQVEHVWHRLGTYQVTLEISDSDGQRRSDQAHIQVTRPDLLQALPPHVGFVLLIRQPPRGLRDLPVFLERLLASGRDVNRLLAAIRETVGFDPLSAEGMSAAGLDPDGGLAVVGLAGRQDVVTMASVLPGHESVHTLLAVLGRSGQIKEQAYGPHPAILELRATDSGELRGAYTYYRGHLCLAMAGEQNLDPRQSLLSLLEQNSGSLGQDPRFIKALSHSRKPAGIQLYLTREYMHRVQGEEIAQAPEAKRQRRQEILERMDHLVSELDVSEHGARGQVRIGLRGPEVERLAGFFRSSETVPPLRGMLPEGQHLVLKMSMDWAGLLRTVLQLGAGEKAWNELGGALDELAANSGVQLRTGILENLGQSSIVALRFKPAGLLGLASGPDRSEKLDGLLSGAALIQVRDVARLGLALDGLAGLSGAQGLLVPFEQAGRKYWRLGSGPMELVLGAAGGFAALASSSDEVRAALKRAAKPGPAVAPWPSTMDSARHQVVALDLGRLIADFENTRVPADDALALSIRSGLAFALAKVGLLSLLSIQVVLERDELITSFSLSLPEAKSMETDGRNDAATSD